MVIRVHVKPTPQFPKGRIAVITLVGNAVVSGGTSETILKDAATGVEYRFDAGTGHFVGWGVFGKSARNFIQDVDASIILEDLP